MKRIALILCATVMAFSGADAMRPDQTVTYVVNTARTVRVIQNPTARRITLDEGLTTPSLTLCSRFYNGNPCYAPLELRYDMTEDQIVEALRKTFGYDKQVAVFGYDKQVAVYRPTEQNRMR